MKLGVHQLKDECLFASHNERSPSLATVIVSRLQLLSFALTPFNRQ